MIIDGEPLARVYPTRILPVLSKVWTSLSCTMRGRLSPIGPWRGIAVRPRKTYDDLVAAQGLQRRGSGHEKLAVRGFPDAPTAGTDARLNVVVAACASRTPPSVAANARTTADRAALAPRKPTRPGNPIRQISPSTRGRPFSFPPSTQPARDLDKRHHRRVRPIILLNVSPPKQKPLRIFIELGNRILQALNVRTRVADERLDVPQSPNWRNA